MDEGRLGITRRGILRTSAALGAFGVFGVPAMGTVAANAGETLYLVENGTTEDPNNYSVLYSVVLTDGPNKATLSKEAVLDDFTKAHIAATPDGKWIYVVDRDTERLGKYEVSSGDFTVIGKIGSYPGQVVLFSFSPSGVLYMASNTTDSLYTVEDYDTTPTATLVGSTGIDVNGADIAFTSDGTLYLYSNAGGRLYTVDTSSGVATAVGEATGQQLTGLAVRDNGTGDLVGSATNSDEIVVFDRDDGSIVDSYPMYLGGSRFDTYDSGDMTVGRLAPTTTTTTFNLCAGQDIDVGTVSITQSTDELEVTYNLTGGWLLYETHVDVADSPAGFPTNKPGNPQVGQFDHSMTHDGVESFEYSGDCDYWGVNADGETLYVAVHAVVKPADGCLNFNGFEAGKSVEGFGTVSPFLNIESTSSVSGATAVAQLEGQTPATYGAPNGSGSVLNGCLDDYGNGAFGGFSDVVTKDAAAPHAYSFTFADDVTASDFSLRMLDFGDYNPKKNTHHYAKMVAYDADGNVVDTHELEYWSDGLVNPKKSYADAARTITKWTNSLYEAGDACDADVSQGEPGNWVWSVSGAKIKRVELTFGDGFDPNIAFTDLCFTANDETAWPCYDQDGVVQFTERGSWATYVEVETFIDCS